LSRDKLPLRADFSFFSAFLFPTQLSLGNVFCLDFHMLVHQRGCTQHLLRFDRYIRAAIAETDTFILCDLETYRCPHTVLFKRQDQR
jgi:hypothetical protein